jgi:hypothetical protein
MAHISLVGRFTVTVPEKYIPGAVRGTISVYGLVGELVSTQSVNENEIPVLKTTMIVESHWRKLKHDYLHRFNRPRIDLVVWVLLTRVIPNSLVRMRTLLNQDHRQAIASWRKAFKRE